MKVENNKVVTINYKLSQEDGTIVDSSENSGTLPYIHGSEFLSPGMEASLTGKTVGETVNEFIPADQAFGEIDQQLYFEIHRSDMNIDASVLEVGLEFEAEIEGQVRYCQVTEIVNDMVRINANHPLSGLNLRFEAEILNIRDATAEELDHGHVHDENGHHHDH